MEKTIRLEIFKKLQCTDKTFRYLLVSLVTACVLCFIGIWNSFEFSWVEKRLDIHKKQIEWYKYIVDPDFIPENAEPKIDIVEFNNCKRYFFEKMYTYETLIQAHNNLNKMFNENYMLIKVPFFGIAYDINDMSLFGGIGFIMILYLILYYANLRKTHFHMALDSANNIKEESLKQDCFRLLYMLQTFTKTYKNENKKTKWTNYLTIVSNCVYSGPLVIYIIIFLYDIITLKNGLVVLNSPGKTVFLIAISFVFLIVILILTYLIYKSVSAYNKLWADIEIKFEE
jgi:hypothetical protein